VKNIKGNNVFTWKKSGLKKGIAYKSYVKAYVYKDGKKKYVYKSPIMHAYTGNGNKKYTNAKSVSLKNVKKGKLTLKKGKTFKIKAKVKKVKKNKKLFPKNHVPTLRYMTSDKKIATVSSKGKIKAKAKGKCYIYTYAHNGVSRSIKVTVK
jgi:polyhydroxyalkanoate synthesis regulator phasin